MPGNLKLLIHLLCLKFNEKLQMIFILKLDKGVTVVVYSDYTNQAIVQLGNNHRPAMVITCCFSWQN
jgi:hypothetical protein